MNEAGSIAGRVVDEAGSPVVGAVVAIASSTAASWRDVAAVTSSDGSFRLGSLLPGTYVLGAHSGAVRGSAECEVRSGAQASAEIRVCGDGSN